MPNTDTKVSQLVINELTKEQFDRAVEAGQVSDTELYLVEDEGGSKASFPLLSTMWADHILNDVSWLRADTFSWQSGDVYKSVYEKLVSEYATGTTETDGAITFKRTESGFKITESTQEQAILDLYNSTGVAWYYILDRTNKRFKLPRTKYNFTGLRDSVGSYVEESLPNITGKFTSTTRNSLFDRDAWEGALYKNATFSGADYPSASSSMYMNWGFDASRSSSTYKDNAPVQQRATQMYLYFYVGNYTQTAIQQTAGLNTELFNGKLDIDSPIAQAPYIVESFRDGNYWYRIWSDGWCEQGDFYESNVNIETITFGKEYIYTPLVITSIQSRTRTSYNDFGIDVYNLSTTGFTKQDLRNVGQGWGWTAKGYIF